MHLNEWQLTAVLGDDGKRHLGEYAECANDSDIECSYCGHSKGVICMYCGFVSRELTNEELSALRRASSIRKTLDVIGQTIVNADTKAKRQRLRTGPFVVRAAIIGIGTLQLRLFLDDGSYLDTAGPLGHRNWE